MTKQQVLEQLQQCGWQDIREAVGGIVAFSDVMAVSLTFEDDTLVAALLDCSASGAEIWFRPDELPSELTVDWAYAELDAVHRAEE